MQRWSFLKYGFREAFFSLSFSDWDCLFLGLCSFLRKPYPIDSEAMLNSFGALFFILTFILNSPFIHSCVFYIALLPFTRKQLLVPSHDILGGLPWTACSHIYPVCLLCSWSQGDAKAQGKKSSLLLVTLPPCLCCALFLLFTLRNKTVDKWENIIDKLHEKKTSLCFFPHSDLELCIGCTLHKCTLLLLLLLMADSLVKSPFSSCPSQGTLETLFMGHQPRQQSLGEGGYRCLHAQG